MASVLKTPPANAGDGRDLGSIPGLRRFPGGGHGNLLQCSRLKSPTDRGAWQSTVHGVTKSWTRSPNMNTGIKVIFSFLMRHVARLQTNICIYESLMQANP